MGLSEVTERLFDLKKISGWRNLFFVIANATYTVTLADLDFLRPLYWIALLLFFIFAGLDWLYLLRKTGREFTSGVFFVWVIAVVGMCVCSQFWAYSPEAVINSQYVANLAYSVFMLGGLFFCTKNRADVYCGMKLYVVAAVLMSAFLIAAQAFSGNMARLGTAFGIVPNGPAMQMGFALMFCLFLLGKGECDRGKYLLLIFFLFVAIILTDSRKIILATAFTFVLFFIYDRRGAIDVRKIMCAIPLVLIVVAAFVFIPFLNETIGYRLVGIFTGVLGDGTVDASSLEREFYRETALTLFGQRPLLGIGFEGFAAYLTSIGYWHVAYSHCNYTELLCNLGIVGLSVYYAFYLFIFSLCLKVRRTDPFTSLAVASIVLIRLFVEYGQVVYIDVDNYVVLFLLYSILKTSSRPNDNNGIRDSRIYGRASLAGGDSLE